MHKKALVQPKQARESAGLTPMQLATKAQVSLATVYNCERRKGYPKHRAQRAAYLAALGLSEAGAP